MSTSSPTQPVVYVPHGGGPWPWMADPGGQYTALRESLTTLRDELPEMPRALAVVSAHWEAPRFSVATSARPPMIYDYGGFPPETYTVSYPAPGDPELAEAVIGLAADAGISVAADPTRGFDHGVFVPMAVAFPEAEIPVVSISLRSGLDPGEHLAFGAALAPLRDDGVLLVGSGLSPHDLTFSATRADVEAFHGWLDDAIGRPRDERKAALTRWASAPGARGSHPREEHLLPLMVAAGAAGDDPGRPALVGELFGLPYTGYRFGAP